MPSVLLHRPQHALKSLGQAVEQFGEDRGVFPRIHHAAGSPRIEDLIQREALNDIGSLKIIESGAIKSVAACGKRREPVLLHCADTGRTDFAPRLTHAPPSETRYDTTPDARRVSCLRAWTSGVPSRADWRNPERGRRMSLRIEA